MGLSELDTQSNALVKLAAPARQLATLAPIVRALCSVLVRNTASSASPSAVCEPQMLDADLRSLSPAVLHTDAIGLTTCSSIVVQDTDQATLHSKG